MKATIELLVTEEDIKGALPANRFCCPIARAAWRRFNNARGIAVDNDRIRVDSHGSTYYCLDNTGVSLIRNFDAGREVLPCVVKIQEDYSY